MTTIMLVDDEMLLRNGLRYLMDWSAEGFDIVAEAANGEEALEYARKYQPQIVLTDVVMPKMNGIDLTRQLKNEFSQMHIVVLSSYNQFEYVKELFKLGIVDYLLKPSVNRENLLAVLNRLRDTNYIQKKLCSPQELLRGALTFDGSDKEYTSQDYQLRGVAFKEGCDYWLLRIKERGNNKAMVERISDSVLALWKELPFVMLESYGEWTVLLQDPQVKTTEAFCQKYSLGLKQMGTRWVSAIASPFQPLRQLKKADHQLSETMGCSFYYPDRNVLTVADAPQHPWQEADLLQELRIQKLSSVQLANGLNLQIREAMKHAYPPEQSLKAAIKDSFFQFIQWIEKQGYDTQSLQQQKLRLFRSLQDAQDVYELQATVEHICQLVHDAMITKGAHGTSTLIPDMQAYIQQHYMEDLKLGELAQLFHVNYSYCSTLFFKETGMHFTNYVNYVRVNHAQELLTQGQNSVGQCGEMVGFINQGYFSKTFKEIVGMSPKRFQQCQKNPH